MLLKRFVLCILAGSLLAACQPQPNKQHADRNEFYRDVKTAKVIVRENYGAVKGIALPFRSVVEAWLTIAGVAAVNESMSSADCIIRIDATGTPLKADYGRSGSLFTGARLAGSIEIERPSLHRDAVRFIGRVDPPRTSPGSGTIDYRKPENAPFLSPLMAGDVRPAEGMDKAAFDEFKARLAMLMGQYFGRTVLLIALDDYNSKGMLRDSAVEALAALGKPAVPYLVDAFLFCSPAAEQGVGEALERITGEKFGTDAKQWNEWLLRQKRQ